jgi:uncharacterized protein YdeI (YjbR/CyaY-like superfamily)
MSVAPTLKPEQPIIAFATADSFRRWLKVHHADHPGIWMQIAKKGSGLQSITYGEALDEALCFGWIDGQRRSHDDQTYLQKFTRRGRRSVWSRVNTGHVERLSRADRMQPAGQAAVDAAKADGRWARACTASRDIAVPADFLAALARHAKAQAFFESLNKTNRDAIAALLEGARKPETRERRFAKFLAMMKRGQKLM